MAEVEGQGTVGSAAVSIDGAGIEVIKFSGEIDMSNVDSLRGAIEPVLDRSAHPRRLRSQFARLHGQQRHRSAAARRGQDRPVHLRGPSPLVRRMIEATGLSDVLLIEP